MTLPEPALQLVMLELHTDIFHSPPRKLARMLSSDWEAEANWRPDELGAILQHQLASPIDRDLSKTKLLRLKECAKPGPSGPRLTFGDLLFAPHPSVELLRLVKDFAKSHLQHPQSSLPQEIAHLLYYASIVVARDRCDKRISQLGDEALAAGVDWVLAQSWVDPATRKLFQSPAAPRK